VWRGRTRGRGRAGVAARGGGRHGSRRGGERRRRGGVEGEVGVAAERVAQGRGVGPAVLGALGEGALHGGREPRRDVGGGLGQGAGALAQLLHEHRRGVAGGERRRAGEHLVAHDAQGVDVAPAVDLALAEGLLGAHVGRGAEHRADLREALGAGVEQRAPRDAEVGDHRAAALAVEQDVVGLDVAVHDAARVRVGERVGHVGEDAADDGHRRARLPGEPRAEALAVDERHREEGDAGALVHREDRHHVRVRETGGRLGLAQEAGAHVGAEGEVRREHLEGDAAPEAQVAGLVHHRHGAAPHLALDLVLVADGRGDALAELVDHVAPAGRAHARRGTTPAAVIAGCALPGARSRVTAPRPARSPRPRAPRPRRARAPSRARRRA
jgi:hypothetical protein